MNPEKWPNVREQLYVPDKKSCAFCGGRLGLILHREGPLRFCSRAHKEAYREQRRFHVHMQVSQAQEDDPVSAGQ